MSRKSLVVAAAFATVVASSFADVPDGKGGRTAAWKLTAPVAVAEEPHACCRLTDSIVAAESTREVVANPAELKAAGHTAWMTRGDRTTASVACYKRVAYRPVLAASPAEAKGLGHVALRAERPAPDAARTCCESGRCPMRLRENVSR